MKKTAAAKFLLTPLREGRPRMLLTPLTRPLFLLTPLREGRPCGLRRLFVLRLDFYSRPCGRGDVPGTGEVLPALYFYSRPCGRGDPAGTPDAPQLGRLFLLTPLREGRRWMLDGTIDIPNISTHAPAGGATSHHVGRGNPLNLFLLTPLREGRPTTVIFLPVAAVFLLTPLREGRRQTERAERLTPKFLLTPLREGRPCAASLARIVGFISTHAPAGGATETTIAYLTGETDISTHAPAGGATSAGSPPRGRVHAISTHAPAGGATRPVARLRRLDLHFYSRPCGRGDPNLRFTKAYAINFYSRPCGRGDKKQLYLRHSGKPFLLTPLREGRHAI